MIPPVRKKVTVSTLVLESSLWKLSPSAKDALRVTLTSARVTLHMELLSNITSTWGSTGTGCSTIVPADWTRASVAFPDQSSKIYTFAVAFESHKLLICSIPGAVSTQVRKLLHDAEAILTGNTNQSVAIPDHMELADAARLFRAGKPLELMSLSAATQVHEGRVWPRRRRSTHSSWSLLLVPRTCTWPAPRALAAARKRNKECKKWCIENQVHLTSAEQSPTHPPTHPPKGPKPPVSGARAVGQQPARVLFVAVHSTQNSIDLADEETSLIFGDLFRKMRWLQALLLLSDDWAR